VLVPDELHPGRLQHAAGRLDQLGAGAVAGDQRDFVRHPSADYLEPHGSGVSKLRHRSAAGRAFERLGATLPTE
jgi:hypothetical protein